MEPGAATLSLSTVISVSLLLVELISPDVMYNGLPWPDEDGCKVSVLEGKKQNSDECINVE